MSSPDCRLVFAGQRFLLHAEGALYWPEERLLIASDLHFEKGSFLAAHGSLVPPYDTQETLRRLQAVVMHYRPERLLLLGDSFHDAGAWARLDAGAQQQLRLLAGSVREMIWLEGNHDRALLEHPLGMFVEELQVGPLLFSHEPVAADRPLVIGHFHPKTQLKTMGRWMRGRCAIHSDRLMILPAFGSYAGGLDIRDPAIAGLFGGAATRVHFLYAGGVYPLPSAPLEQI